VLVDANKQINKQTNKQTLHSHHRNFFGTFCATSAYAGRPGQNKPWEAGSNKRDSGCCICICDSVSGSLKEFKVTAAMRLAAVEIIEKIMLHLLQRSDLLKGNLRTNPPAASKPPLDPSGHGEKHTRNRDFRMSIGFY
jgi:hypothetical protein